MSLTPSNQVNDVTTIEFSDALAQLQALLGWQLRVVVNFHGTFGSCAFEGKLTRVQTLPPDHSVINILLDDRQSLMLDPIDTDVLLVGGGREGERLEFHLPSGVVGTLALA